MRSFVDGTGRAWMASVRKRAGLDYKGRYHLSLAPEGGGAEEAVDLLDIRWNSERTARRTLETMSEVELRRRLRQGLGRDRDSVATVLPDPE